MTDWQITNLGVMGFELSTQQNLLTRRYTGCCLGAEEGLLLTDVTQCKKLTKLCSFGVLCAYFCFPFYIQKLVIYHRHWEDYHGAVDLHG